MLIRERAHAAFRNNLSQIGLDVLATASYPIGGVDDGCTVAMVIGCQESQMNEVKQAWYDAAERVFLKRKKGRSKG